MIVTFNIVSIPTENTEHIAMIASKIKPPGTMKKADTIEKWVREEKQNAIDEAVLKTTFDGAYGSICCIGWKIDKNETQTVVGTEKEIIKAFFDSLLTKFHPTNDTIKFVGHNLIDFDLPFLFKRCVINNIPLLSYIPINPRFGSDKVFDTSTEFAGYGKRISLDTLSKLLGMAGKVGMTGDDVYPTYQAGRIDDIADYCVGNVDLTHAVYERLNFLA
jgi:3'-5' exonuclease